MVLEGLSPKQIVERELATGVPIVYRLGSDSRPTSVEILKG
jgi:2,3-bisphosphoglycerate-dependent phosphoglycerate mutase